MIRFRTGGVTDVGVVRESNQDSFLVSNPLFAVADGMGGHQGGEVASATALEALDSAFKKDISKDSFVEAVRRANAKVWDRAQLDENLHGMGTTLTAVAAVPNDDGASKRITVINIGDSRTYLLRAGQLSRLTTDHSLVEEMVRTGQISPEEAESHPRRNIVTRALGVEPTVEADVEDIDPQPGDRLLLCSDGLTRELEDDQISAVLRQLRNPDEAAHELVTQAKAHGGHDNITVVIVDVEEAEAEPATNVPIDAQKKRKDKRPKEELAEDDKTDTATPRKFTFRVLLFFLTVLALIAVACGSVLWYARAAYFVGLEGNQLVIYRGHPQKVLWFEPTVTQRTDVSTNQVPATRLADLQKGVTESSLDNARKYIANLVDQANEEAAHAAPVTSAPATPTSTTTVRSR